MVMVVVNLRKIILTWRNPIEIRYIQRQLRLNQKIQRWWIVQIHTRPQLIRWLDHCWIYRHVKKHPHQKNFLLITQETWWNRNPSINRLEKERCRHPRQKPRIMWILLVILRHWSLRRSQLHHQRWLIVILRIITLWLLHFIRKQGMPRWIDGLCFQIHRKIRMWNRIWISIQGRRWILWIQSCWWKIQKHRIQWCHCQQLCLIESRHCLITRFSRHPS